MIDSYITYITRVALGFVIVGDVVLMVCSSFAFILLRNRKLVADFHYDFDVGWK